MIEIPRLLWLPFFYVILLPLLPRRSTPLYKKIWGKKHAPLLEITLDVVAKLKERWRKEDYPCGVHYCMSYSEPQLAKVMDELMAAEVERVLILPQYPQYSATTTAAVYDQLSDWVKKQRVLPEVAVLRDYHDHPLYIKALAAQVRAHWRKHPQAQRLLLSFHGLPERCVAMGDPYVTQCKRTTELLVKELGLKKDQWLLSFQSRFGPARWVQPYTDETLERLAKDGVASVDVICPGFSVDCLETLEEIEITNKELFMEHGGKEYRFIPCLNSGAGQIELLDALTRTKFKTD